MLDLSVPELLHFYKLLCFEELDQNFRLFIGLVGLPKALKAEVASNRMFSKRILTSIESKFI